MISHRAYMIEQAVWNVAEEGGFLTVSGPLDVMRRWSRQFSDCGQLWVRDRIVAEFERITGDVVADIFAPSKSNAPKTAADKRYGGVLSERL